MNLIHLIVLINHRIDWTGPLEHWLGGRSLPVVGCGIFFLFMNGLNIFDVVDEKIVFLQGGEVMFVGTVVGPVSVIVEFFVLDNKRLFVAPADWGGRVMLGVGLGSQVEVDGNERNIFLIALLIMGIFFDFLNGGKIVNGVLMWRGILFVLFLMFGALMVCFEQHFRSVDVEGLWDLHVVKVVNVSPGLGCLLFH
jgi:hypothetical protein